MTLNTYKVVGLNTAEKTYDDGSTKTLYIAYCVSKDKIANEGYRVSTVFADENTFVGDEVLIGYVDKHDRIIKVK